MRGVRKMQHHCWHIYFFMAFSMALSANNLLSNSFKLTPVLTNVGDNSNWKILTPAQKKKFECSPLFCLNIICKPVTECTDGEIIPKASLCRCCDKCIKYNINGTGRCDAVAKHRKTLKSNFISEIPFSDKLWIPDCDNVGRFRAKQCKNKKCICVDENGVTLFGQEERDLAQNMTCGCSRSMKKLEISSSDHWMTNAQEHCTSTGDYKPLQCINDLCYCTDSISGEVQGRIMKKQLLEFLPCYDSKEIGKHYETQCELQLTRSRSLRYQFHKKNIDIVDLEYEKCDLDGTFGAKQCLTDKCVCTNRNGLGIKSYYVEKIGRNEEFTMKCNCARDEYDNEALHARYPRMVCEGNGNFQNLQCFGIDSCYCVDEDGDFITEKLTRELAVTAKCLDVLNNLQMNT